MRTQCYMCGDPLDTEAIGVYQYVRGWGRLRKGGGINAIRLPERAQRWACHACIEIKVAGFDDQGQLW